MEENDENHGDEVMGGAKEWDTHQSDWQQPCRHLPCSNAAVDSTYIYLHLLTSTYISLTCRHLPCSNAVESTYIYFHLLTSV